jgi:hypothetical protein
MYQHTYDGLVVFVQKKTTSFELRQEALNCASGCLESFEGDVLRQIGGCPKAPGLDAVVEDCSPPVTASVVM